MAWYIKKQWELLLAQKRISFYVVYCYEMNLMSRHHRCERVDLIDMFHEAYPLDILTIYSVSITLNLRNITLVELSKYFRQRNFFHGFKFRSY